MKSWSEGVHGEIDFKTRKRDCETNGGVGAVQESQSAIIAQ